MLSWEKDNVKADFLRGNVEQMQKYSSKNLMILNFFYCIQHNNTVPTFFITTILVSIAVHNFHTC